MSVSPRSTDKASARRGERERERERRREDKEEKDRQETLCSTDRDKTPNRAGIPEQLLGNKRGTNC